MSRAQGLPAGGWGISWALKDAELRSIGEHGGEGAVMLGVVRSEK